MATFKLHGKSCYLIQHFNNNFELILDVWRGKKKRTRRFVGRKYKPDSLDKWINQLCKTNNLNKGILKDMRFGR